MTRLIFIHGRAQQELNPATLKADWTGALRAGLQSQGLDLPVKTRIEFPYYGDLLHELAQQQQQASGQVVTSKGVALDGDAQELEFVGEVLGEVARRRGVTRQQVQAELGIAGPVVNDMGFQNWAIVLAALRLLDKVPGAADGSIHIATHDVWLYLTSKPINTAVQKLVYESFAPDEKVVVVSHSLGSIVAFNALNALQLGDNVRGWVTLGSPLGISAIYQRLPSFSSPRRAPMGALSWYNARDPHDTVALYDIPQSAFPNSPHVENSSHVHNDSSNQHGIREYLRDKAVAKRIYDMLKS